MKTDNGYYPIFLNIRNKNCVVVGGGQVALRKVRTLLKYGAHIKVISPQICSGLIGLADKKRIQIMQRDYRPDDLMGALIVVAATDNHEENQNILNYAHQHKALVNVVDSADESDFIVPSCVNRGDITIAVSSSGKSPALARKIARKLKMEIGVEYTALLNVIAQIRRELKNKKITASGARWDKALELDTLIDLIRQKRYTEAKRQIMKKLNVKQQEKSK